MTASQPQSPVLLFEEDGRMFIIHDISVTDELIEDVTDFYEGFDGLARPVRPVGVPGKVEFVLVSEQSDESVVRGRVRRYYTRYASRHRTRTPPNVADVRSFVFAVANDEVVE
ncbi:MULTISPECIES: hypothetical protein [unclassified Streptomyces]|uniref:hypothetical protein n=1 Tax=unclassified Streptomyces TaxID=2593676 RepID=UPI00114CAB5B|nr:MULTISPECIES: hypothetical protein [unclassified Streptomyces]MYR97879.1 hypothetical protein [Streptomyces sp. SID4937]